MKIGSSARTLGAAWNGEGRRGSGFVEAVPECGLGRALEPNFATPPSRRGTVVSASRCLISIFRVSYRFHANPRICRDMRDDFPRSTDAFDRGEGPAFWFATEGESQMQILRPRAGLRMTEWGRGGAGGRQTRVELRVLPCETASLCAAPWSAGREAAALAWHGFALPVRLLRDSRAITKRKAAASRPALQGAALSSKCCRGWRTTCFPLSAIWGQVQTPGLGVCESALIYSGEIIQVRITENADTEPRGLPPRKFQPEKSRREGHGGAA